MRRLTPALDGRISRRAIVHSPHTWNATAVTFLMFGISDFVVAWIVPELEPARLFPLAAFISLIGIGFFVTKPPEPGTAGTHVVVAAVYVGVSAAIFAHGPQGSAIVGTGVFIPVLAALWIEDRRQAIMHQLIAFALLLAAALLGDNDTGTIVAVVCFAPACIGLYTACSLVLDGIELQGEALDVLALRDPLTGVGNRRALDTALAVELTRHRSSGRPLSVIDLTLIDFVALNDRVGRAAGDAVLTALARALALVAPEQATVARLDGDRFVIVLPDAGRRSAAGYLRRVLESLPAEAGEAPLVVRAGVSTFPFDGHTAEALMITAFERSRADSGQATAGHADARPWTVPFTALEPVAPPELPLRVTRRALARNRAIWRTIGAAFLGHAAVTAAAQLITGDLAGRGFGWVAAATAAFGFICLLSRPPRIGRWQNHVLIAASYLLPFATMLTAAPRASWVLVTALLAPLLISVRLVERREIFAHFTAITVLAIALFASGLLDHIAMVGMTELIINTWVLGVCVMIVFEAAEVQWAEIDRLVLRDVLTGAGNRDLLEQRLAEELPRHDALQLSLALVELDLVGFDDLQRKDGRGAANHVLRDTALVVSGVVGPGATVARTSGSTFQILMPVTDFADPGGATAEVIARQLRGAIVGTSRRGRTLMTRIGVAQYPEDAESAAELHEIVTARRLADDPYSHPIEMPGRTAPGSDARTPSQNAA